MKVALLIHSNIFKKVDGMTNYYNRLCSSAGAARHSIDVFMQADEVERQIQKKSVFQRHTQPHNDVCHHLRFSPV